LRQFSKIAAPAQIFEPSQIGTPDNPDFVVFLRQAGASPDGAAIPATATALLTGKSMAKDACNIDYIF
jgi:hypothetical protein